MVKGNFKIRQYLKKVEGNIRAKKTASQTGGQTDGQTDKTRQDKTERQTDKQFCWQTAGNLASRLHSDRIRTRRIKKYITITGLQEKNIRHMYASKRHSKKKSRK